MNRARLEPLFQTLTFFLSFIANMELTLSSMDLERKEDSSDVNSILKKVDFLFMSKDWFFFNHLRILLVLVKRLSLLKIFQSITGRVYMRTKAPVCFHDLCEARGTPDLALYAFVSVGQVCIIFLETQMKNSGNA